MGLCTVQIKIGSLIGKLEDSNIFCQYYHGIFKVHFNTGKSCRVYRSTNYKNLPRIEEDIWYYVVDNGAGFLSSK